MLILGRRQEAKACKLQPFEHEYAKQLARGEHEREVGVVRRRQDVTDREDQYDGRGTLIDVADEGEEADHVEGKSLRRGRPQATKTALPALGEITMVLLPTMAQTFIQLAILRDDVCERP